MQHPAGGQPAKVALTAVLRKRIVFVNGFFDFHEAAHVLKSSRSSRAHLILLARLQIGSAGLFDAQGDFIRGNSQHHPPSRGFAGKSRFRLDREFN